MYPEKYFGEEIDCVKIELEYRKLQTFIQQVSRYLENRRFSCQRFGAITPRRTVLMRQDFDTSSLLNNGKIIA